jgi:hypothetical protein
MALVPEPVIVNPLETLKNELALVWHYWKRMNTKHKADCKMAFGRKDQECPRCQELLAGAPSRAGWQKQYYARKKQEEIRTLEAIRSHDFKACAEKNIVCTHFDW